jgi:hypothetical protein
VTVAVAIEVRSCVLRAVSVEVAGTKTTVVTIGIVLIEVKVLV